MPDLSIRVVAFYVALAFPLGLFCAIPFFDRPSALDDEAERRHLRRALLLVLASPVHVLLPLTAYGMVRDARTFATDVERNHDRRRRTAALAAAGMIVALIIAVAVAVATA